MIITNYYRPIITNYYRPKTIIGTIVITITTANNSALISLANNTNTKLLLFICLIQKFEIFYY